MTLATVHADLRAAFRQVLQSVPSLPAVAWEARKFTPVVGTPFVAESFRSISSQVRSIGRSAAGGTIAHVMTGNLTLMYPIGEGTLAIEAMAGSIMDAFKPALSLAYGSSKGTVTQVERRPLYQDADWLSCPVIVSITAHSFT